MPAGVTTYIFRQFQIPPRVMPALLGYVTHGYPVGGFLRAVVCNDLAAAVVSADDDNLPNLPAFIRYLYDEAPPACWGSEEKMRAWIAHMTEQRGLASSRLPATTQCYVHVAEGNDKASQCALSLGHAGDHQTAEGHRWWNPRSGGGRWRR